MNVHGYVTWGTSLSPFIFQNMSNYACLVSVACIFRRFLFSVLWVVLILIFGLLDWVSTNTIKFWLEHDHDLTCVFTADFLIMCFSSCLNEDVMAKEDACATLGKYFFKCWVCMEKFSSLIIFEYLYEYIFPKAPLVSSMAVDLSCPFLRKTETWQLNVKWEFHLIVDSFLINSS